MYEIIEINSGIETILYAATDKRKVKQEMERRAGQHIRLKVDGRIYTLYEAECFLKDKAPRKISEAAKKIPCKKERIRPNARPVECIDAHGNVIKRYDSVIAAANAENIEPCSMRLRMERGNANGKGERFRYAAR